MPKNVVLCCDGTANEFAQNNTNVVKLYFTVVQDPAIQVAFYHPGIGTMDRWIFVGFYRLFPDVRDALAILRPETVIRWHRAGFRAYWRWKSRPRAGRPKVPLEIRRLIRDMSLANPLWGAPRIHGELL